MVLFAITAILYQLFFIINFARKLHIAYNTMQNLFDRRTINIINDRMIRDLDMSQSFTSFLQMISDEIVSMYSLEHISMSCMYGRFSTWSVTLLFTTIVLSTSFICHTSFGNREMALRKRKNNLAKVNKGDKHLPEAVTQSLIISCRFCFKTTP